MEKPFVARQILEVLTKKKIEIACTCTTGIACTLYERCSARTIHSFAGIGQCRGSKEMLLRNVLANNECVRRWRETEVLFIDEISMLSQRILEIKNYVAQNGRISEYLFGGLQLVAFGDFLQLPPVPNTVDDGKYAFESTVWDLTFPHQVILEESFCAQNDEEFINLLREISRGQCSEQSAEIIQSLSRPLNPSDFGLSYIPKVYPLNEDVDFANMCVLETLPGEQILFEATDVGDKRLLNNGLIASEKLVLKVWAKVMFIYNLNDGIKNGVQGTVTSSLNGLPVVTTESESLLVDRIIVPQQEEETLGSQGNAKIVVSYGPKKPKFESISIRQWEVAKENCQLLQLFKSILLVLLG